VAKLNNAELHRYARHIVLKEIGGLGQKELKKAKAAIVGAGGLGVPVLQYLNSAGVGELKVIDHDVVSLPNLQRQVLFDEAHVGQPKVEVAQQVLGAQNSNTTLIPIYKELNAKNALEFLKGCDVVIDASDSYDTRRIINRVCIELKQPMIFGAISQWEGQLSVLFGQPCFECLFPVKPQGELLKTCSEFGVVASLPGVIGCMMATEVIKLITSAGAPLRNKLLIMDMLYSETRIINTFANPNCNVCC